jgi:hypothetical protein
VSRNFGGSCQIPLAAFATIDKGTMRLRAMIATPDGLRVAHADLSGAADAPEALGAEIAQALRHAGRHARFSPPVTRTLPRMPDSSLPCVVITRPLAQAGELAQRVAALGHEAVIFPLLDILPLPDQAALQHALRDLQRYALIAFVSPNAIDAAFAARPDWPLDIPLAVVGEGSRIALADMASRPQTAPSSVRAIRNAPIPHTLLEELDLPALRDRQVLIVRGETGRPNCWAMPCVALARG